MSTNLPSTPITLDKEQDVAWLKNRISELEEEIESRHQVAEMTTIYLKQMQDDLRAKHDEISAINRKLTDSIQYALRIQKAVTPSEEALKRHFPNAFVLHRPQSILSGDIPWAEQVGKYKLIAAIDCTGHGVPGAMLSILAFSLLKKIVNAKNAFDPAAILKALDKSIYAYTQNEDMKQQIKDGMDVAMLCIDMDTHEARFAGAHRPLFYMRNGELHEIKGARYSLGEYDAKRAQKIRNHRLQFEENDMMYLFSDGYSDQFGETTMKKFTVGRFKHLLTDMASLDLQAQQQHLWKVHEEWKGDKQQTDDILIVALKVTGNHLR